MGVPGRIGDLQPFAELGRGAATIVYKAYQQSLNRVVLLKLLRPDYTHSEEIVRRFEEEARLIAKIQHPNVVTIYNYGRADGRSFFVAEYIEGADLATLLEDHGALPLELATYIIREAARGLAAAHRSNILHRDIKPRNILIGADGRVKLTDFGMASIILEEETRGEVRGTPEYMAPEQLARDTTTSASDLFSLGATLYEMLAGRQAFPGDEISDCIDGVLNRDPLPALALVRALPDDLTRILKRLLAKDPSRRFSDCRPLIDAIDRFRTKYHLSAESAELASYLDNPDVYEPEVTREDIAVVDAGERDDEEVEEIGEAQSRFDELLRRAAARYRLYPNIYRGVLAMVSLLVIGMAGYLLSAPEERSVASEAAVQERAVVLPDSIRGDDPVSAYTTGRLFFLPGRSAPDSVNTAEQDEEPDSRPATVQGSREQADVGTRGYLTVRSTPPAAVYLNGDSVGSTPMNDSIEVESGRHDLLVMHPAFPDYRDSVDVEVDEETAVEVAFESLVGRVDIRVNPWARVYIDGALRDTIPPDSPFFLAPGRHVLSLRHPELGRRDTTVRVSAGDYHELEFNLHQAR